ncbi:ribonucleoside triphosphate reductase [Candidatus Dojkabacteria bacterium]|nr:ribonucleoside triphosphate reductase [Candidatus Dojkabacteria bacterium]
MGRTKKTVRKKLSLSPKQLIEEYIEDDDFSRRGAAAIGKRGKKVATAADLGSYSKEGANVMYSFPGLLNSVFEKVSKLYFLNEDLPKESASAHLDGDIYIHDLGKGMVGYCAGWSLMKLLVEGLNGVPDRMSSTPPKHLHSAVDQMGRFIQIVCNEWAGAQAFSSVDTYLAPYVYYDGLPYREIKQNIQRLFFMLNTTIRHGGKVPFSNISLDWEIPEDLAGQKVVIGGKVMKEKYGEFQREADLINRAILEVFMEGDSSEQPFSYPIPTYNLTKDFDWDSSNADLLFELTAKYGTPYFQNFINSDLNPRDVRAMCCRLQMNLKDLANKTGGLFGAGESTGSVCVVDVNLGRVGYEAKGKSEKELFNILKKKMDLCRDVLEHKRKYITENLERGLMPYTKRYLGSFRTFFNTVGLVGMNEMLVNYMGKTLAEVEARDLGVKVLRFMKKTIQKYQEDSGNIYNLEASPAESASYHLARLDKEKYPDIFTQGNGDPYYTNSSQLPVDATDDLFEALDLQEPLQREYTGGTVFHVYLGERLRNAEECRKMVKKIASSYKVPYFSITPTFSVCQEHGYIKGEVQECPKCGGQTYIYSRVVGYYRPVVRWNKGKSSEYRDRKTFKV